MKKYGFVFSVILILGVISIETAKAYETFICRSTAFKDAIGLNKGEKDGQCVLYVRYETEIPYSGCNGEAWTCYYDAQQAGYAVGQEPRVGAIIIFDKDPTKKNLKLVT